MVNRVALVIGATGHIGEEISRVLAAKKVVVCVGFHSNSERAKQFT